MSNICVSHAEDRGGSASQEEGETQSKVQGLEGDGSLGTCLQIRVPTVMRERKVQAGGRWWPGYVSWLL